MPAIQITGLHKGFAKQSVLRAVDLVTEPGEFVGLVGANGAGKTTLIKTLLDFVQPDAGELLVFGQPNISEAAKRQLSYLPERFQPPYYQSGEQFLRMVLGFHAKPYEPRAAEHLLDRLALDPSCLKRRASSYSKGMAQKLGLAASILSKAPLLILDEPMSGLDPLARARFKAVLEEQKKRRVSLFFSTHMLSDIESICDSIALLHEGEVRFRGTPGECKRRYGGNDLEASYLNCIVAAEQRRLVA